MQLQQLPMAELQKIRDKFSFSSIKMSLKFVIFYVTLTLGKVKTENLASYLRIFPLASRVGITGDIFPDAGCANLFWWKLTTVPIDKQNR